MNEREKVYRILHRALVDIRYHSISNPESMYYKISDVLHNVPLQLLKAEGSEEAIEILNDIERRAIRNGVKQWLDIILIDIESNSIGRIK